MSSQWTRKQFAYKGLYIRNLRATDGSQLDTILKELGHESYVDRKIYCSGDEWKKATCALWYRSESDAFVALKHLNGLCHPIYTKGERLQVYFHLDSTSKEPATVPLPDLDGPGRAARARIPHGSVSRHMLRPSHVCAPPGSVRGQGYRMPPPDIDDDIPDRKRPRRAEAESTPTFAVPEVKRRAVGVSLRNYVWSLFEVAIKEPQVPVNPWANIRFRISTAKYVQDNNVNFSINAMGVKCRWEGREQELSGLSPELFRKFFMNWERGNWYILRDAVEQVSTALRDTASKGCKLPLTFHVYCEHATHRSACLASVLAHVCFPGATIAPSTERTINDAKMYLKAVS